MKRYICLIISLCLVFGNFSFVFATATDWDTSDQANLRAIKNLLDSGGGIYNMISSINSTSNTISNNLNTIKGYLYESGHSIAYWVNAIDTWMSPIYTALTAVPTDLGTIQGLLGYPDTSSGGTTWIPYLKQIYDLDNFNGASDIGGSFTLFNPLAGGQYSSYTYSGYYNWRYTIGTLLSAIDQAIVSSYAYETQALSQYYNASQNAVNWGNLGTSSFTPVSSTDGIYKWLSAIQAPVARLSYVLASDERIAAQQAAALAEQEVVDDFIDPAGDSSATASDFGSISDLSSGYQQNFGSTASVSGIFNIFDSNNFGWFSSETYQQLDTTVAQRGSSFETPLLDQQLEDISRALGVDYAN